MKIAYPCPKCGEVVLSNKCKSCGYEILPETPEPKIEEHEKKVDSKKQRKLSTDKILRF